MPYILRSFTDENRVIVMEMREKDSFRRMPQECTFTEVEQNSAIYIY